MSSTIDLTYRDGRLDEIRMSSPERVFLTDCRDSDSEPFIGLHVKDDDTELTAFLPPELAEELYALLGNLLHVDETAEQEAEAAVPAVQPAT